MQIVEKVKLSIYNFTTLQSKYDRLSSISESQLSQQMRDLKFCRTFGNIQPNRDRRFFVSSGNATILRLTKF
jgi:hypothetical protein